MDIEELLKSLNAHNVEFVIIEATAFPIHGYARATLDVDIFIRPEPKNAGRTLDALRDFGYDTAEITVEDLLTRKVLIRQYLVETDIHPFVTGITLIMYGKIGSPELLERRRFTMPLWMTSS